MAIGETLNIKEGGSVDISYWRTLPYEIKIFECNALVQELGKPDVFVTIKCNHD
ncbi:hypothetical protein KFK09_006510 [Dendrobium nobile]|uniref:Uncharacterized protein n=1 Tax=Dendrobium nobile TaxID=94219 RepID=A0A8T3BRK0_DENNO|nr:hypothetical protein KFK09_006510 [Dendrobium nobile]